MQLQLGQVPTFIFSSPETAKDVFKTHDLVFASRPRLHSLKLISYGYADIVLSPYGEQWKQLRKICTTLLLSPTRVRLLRPIREEEISNNLIRAISSNEARVVNLQAILLSTGLDIFSRVTFGGKSGYHEEFIKLVPDIMELFGGSSLVDLFPSFKLLHVVHGLIHKSKLYEQVDGTLEKIIMEQRSKKAAGLAEEGHDFLSVLLDLQDCGDTANPLTTNTIKAIMLDMFLGGIDTMATTVEWAMSEMLKNPTIMDKAQAEVRHVFAKEGSRVNEAGLEELKYLKLVIKETLRLHPPGPLMVPRETMERCEINGYEIPAKSRVIVNVWAIGRDPNYWTEAESFVPERFLDSAVDFKGNSSFEFIPFGAGRRMCVGISFASSVIELELANLLYHFDWKLPDGQNPETLDMSEEFKIVSRRKHDLCLVPIPYHRSIHSSK